MCELPVGENYSDHLLFFTCWKLRDRGLTLGDMPMITPEYDWTAGLGGDFVAWHRHDEVKGSAKNLLPGKDSEMLMASGKPHSQSYVV